jgi:hypothetical protein
MRASPPFQASLHRFGIWRGAMLVLALLCVSTTVAWLATREQQPSILLLSATGLGCIVLVWTAVLLGNAPAVCLRWDGQSWGLGRPDADPDTFVTGNLVVTIDLGPWMLLRFSPLMLATSRWRPTSTWVPAQRLGVEPHWHGLRCAVYSPRPAAVAIGAATTASARAATPGPAAEC